MAGPGTIKNLFLKIGSDHKIRGHHDLEIFGDIKEVPISLSSHMERDILMWIRMLRQNRLVYREEFETIGTNLYSVLLNNKIGEIVNRILFEYNSANGGTADILRIELEFAEEQKGLASWPWEYLFCRETSMFLAESRRLVLLRHIPFQYRARPILVNESPIRVLFVAVSPNGLTQIEFDSVLKSMKDLEGSSNFKVLWLTSSLRKMGELQVQNTIEPTRKNFIDAINIRQFNPHVIHFVGHGRYYEGRSQLAFMDGEGNADWADDYQLAGWLMDNQELRLVFFQAGESALSTPSNPYQDFSGLANHLASKNVPAVIAMQYKIKASVADLFASAFYKALASSFSIEEAVQDGRLQVQSTMSSDEAHSYGYAFCLPVLYMNGSGPLLPMQQVPLTSIGNDGISKNQPLLRCVWCILPCRSLSKFCNNCGGALICTVCQTRVKKGDQSCSKCGEALRQPHKFGTESDAQTG